MVVLLYKSGIPVILTNDFSELKFDIEGFLIEFTYKTVIEKNTINTKYIFYNKSSFKVADKKRSDLTDGFYDEKQFLKYIENTGPNIPLGSDMIYKYKFNFQKFIAKAGDPISVSVTNFDAPYDLFYDRKKYDFIIENSIDNKGVRSYSDGILDGFETIDYKLRLPINFTSSIINVTNQINSPGYYFYLKNLGQFLNQYNNNDEKRKLKKITILIIFKIRDIVKNIFPNILNDETSEAILEAVANDVDTDLNNLSELEKMIFLLYKSWGYYYDPNSNRPHRNNLPLIAQQPSYQDLESYYTALVSFYSKCYKIPHALSTFPADIKYDYLLEILPVNALSALPFETIKKALLSILKLGKITEKTEQFTARLVASIPESKADVFLDFLLQKEDGKNNNYECLYNILDDTVHNDFYLKWLPDSKTNRKTFVFAVYGLWKVSKYNIYFVPNGTTPLSENINPNAYFLQNTKDFVENNIITFSSKMDLALGSNRVSLIDVSFDARMDGSKVIINTTEKKKNIYTNNFLVSSTAAALGRGTEKNILFGNFHIFHPIYLIGYDANLELQIPQNNYVPAFLFHYIKEFDDIRDFEELINLVVLVTFEVGLAYFTGGFSSLRHLNHLKYTYRIFQAMTNPALAGERILIFSALEGTANGISIFGSLLYSYNSYLQATENNPLMAERRAHLSNILLFIVLASAAGSVFFKLKAVNAAEAFLDSIPSGSIPQDIEELLIAISGQKAESILSIRNKILQVEGKNKIISKFDTYSASVKEAMYNDFINYTKADFNLLNKYEGIAIERWKYLYDKGIVTDRSLLDVITSVRKTSDLVRYYEHLSLKNYLEPLTITDRWRYLNKHGNIEADVFSKLVDNPNGITLLDEAFVIPRGKGYLLVDDIKTALKGGIGKDEIGTLIERQRLTWETSINLSKKNINYVEMSLEDLRNFDENFRSYFTGQKRGDFTERNRIYVRIGCYNNNQLIEPIITEWYMSGTQEFFDYLFDVNIPFSVRQKFIQPSDLKRYEAFVLNALDDTGRTRLNDTELKFLFNFFENHFHKGNRFAIEIESVLYTCTSCQKYLQAAQAYAKSQGKILDITFIAHPDAIDTGIVRILKQQL